jgi:hypothetical protein
MVGNMTGTPPPCGCDGEAASGGVTAFCVAVVAGLSCGGYCAVLRGSWRGSVAVLTATAAVLWGCGRRVSCLAIPRVQPGRTLDGEIPADSSEGKTQPPTHGAGYLGGWQRCVAVFCPPMCLRGNVLCVDVAPTVTGHEQWPWPL